MKIIWIIFAILILLMNQVSGCAPFTSELIVIWEYNWLLENDIPDEREAKWDKIITISDYSNWDFSDYFTVHEIWKLTCNEKNELSIENRQWYFKAFWKEIWRCGSMKGKVPDYILSEDEILTKIENKYKLCKNKKIVKENIDENMEKSTINEIVENNSEDISNIIPWYTKIFQWIIDFFKNIF